MEDPFLQTRLLLHVNVGLAEDQIVGTVGPSCCAGNALPEQHHLLACPLIEIGERFTSLLRFGGNLRCGGDLRAHLAAHCAKKQSCGDTADDICQDRQDSCEGTPLHLRTFRVDTGDRLDTRRQARQRAS